jgi:hypothetical protein
MKEKLNKNEEGIQQLLKDLDLPILDPEEDAKLTNLNNDLESKSSGKA